MKKSLSMIAMSLLMGGALSAAEEVSVKSLLNDMTNREIHTTFPSDSFQCKQFSSYSRMAKSPEDGWFSNWDWSNFLRIEKNEGRTEYVMMDHKGPGSIVRFWMTFARGSHNGYLRIYIDGAKNPVIEGKAIDVLSGGKVAGAPLSSSSSERTHLHRRGHNLYMPIPYAKSCKVTIETPTLTGKLNELGQVAGSFVYYNINYREYSQDTPVKSFTQEELKSNADLIKQVNETLLKPMPEQKLTETTLEKNIKAGATESIKLDGESWWGMAGSAKAIKKLTVKLDAKNLNQAMRSTVLAIEFDGKETVWVPVGDFFGTGYKMSPYKSWYTEVTEDGTMSCSWVMPFEDDAKVSFINFGEQDVKVSAVIGTEEQEWTKDSLYFHSSWFEKNRVKTVAHSGSNPHVGTGAEDVNFITLDGKGVFIGDSLTLFNMAEGRGNKWWGEGDEKIYVDGETFPSHFGTGTEDYYGYAWCRPEKFHTPFIAQPDGSGDLGPGMTVNSRYRLLDQIPFTTSFKFDMELWHWLGTYMNYAPAVFYYATADTTSNAIKDIKNVKEKVVLRRADMFPPEPPVLKGETGKIESEAMVIAAVNGRAESQGLGGWSGESQVWWVRPAKGAELVMTFKSEKELTKQLDIAYTIAVDYGIVDVYFNGQQIENDLDLYNATLNRKTKSYKNTVIKKGNNKLKFVMKGQNAAAKGNIFGFDYLEVK